MSKDRQFTQDGILLIDKPAGWTSHDVVARVRKLVGTRRVGHTGTLDPFATGLLVICVNRATRLVQFLTGEDKAYEAVVRFGWATETGDLTGKALAEMAVATPDLIAQITSTALEAAAHQLRGRILQTPPMYSAKKIGGVKLYERARQGETVERQPVKVEIKELAFGTPASAASNEQTFLDVPMRTVCTAGTYVRVLAEDLGKQLGVGAHLTELRRTRVGQFHLQQVLTLEQLAELGQTQQIAQALTPLIRALPFPQIVISETEQHAIAHGRGLPSPSNTTPAGTLTALCNARGELVAIARYDAAAQAWQPSIVLCEPVRQAV